MQATTFSMKAISNWVYVKEIKKKKKKKKKKEDNSMREQEAAALAVFKEQNIGSVISKPPLPQILYV